MANKISISKETLGKLYLAERLNAYQIAKKLNCGSTTVYRKLEERGIKRRDISSCHLRYRKNPFSGSKEEMAYLIGFRLGDLHVRKAINSPGCKTVRVEAHTTKPVQIKLAKLLFEKYSHVHCREISNKTIRALCFLDESFAFLLPKKDGIERWIADDGNLFFAFLAGYTDAEGHFSVHSRNGAAQFKLQTQDKGIVHSIHKNLIRRGMKSHLRLSVPAGYRSPSYPSRPNNRDMWEISVYMPSIEVLINSLLPYLKHEKRKSDAIIVLNHIRVGRNGKRKNSMAQLD